MLFRITQRHSQSNNTGPKHVDRSTGMTGMQKNLWRLVWHMKDKVNVDLEFGGQHAAIRQFWCEKWVWRTYCELILSFLKLSSYLEVQC